MKYPDDMDKACVPLCDMLNALPGIRTYESCCGHGKGPLTIHFIVYGKHEKALPPALYYFDSCHAGIGGWQVTVHTDCAMDGVKYTAESRSVGDVAYTEAIQIAANIQTFLQKQGESE